MAKTKLPRAGMELGTSTVFEGRSRKGYTITDNHRRMVTSMRANGMQHEAIADVMHISKRTLEKQFKDELAYGFECIRAGMGAALVQAGLDGNVSAMKFWLANRCPEWRKAAEQIGDVPERDDEVVHFFLPPNHRDEPEDYEPPIIDGTAEAA